MIRRIVKDRPLREIPATIHRGHRKETNRGLEDRPVHRQVLMGTNRNAQLIPEMEMNHIILKGQKILVICRRIQDTKMLVSTIKMLVIIVLRALP